MLANSMRHMIDLRKAGSNDFPMDEDESIQWFKEKVKWREGSLESDKAAASRVQKHCDENEPGSQRAVEGRIVLMTEVHEEATEENIHDKFAELDEIKDLHLNPDRRMEYCEGLCAGGV
ncbi:hypothetical protein Z043_107303 [Scleropages formosus]|uniref:RRM domain-containing protein n=1 Tax=Scleropages formosus TaxID=113540 RepID=A0A0P7UUJ2_SCLFO|nr:hypothetical protein Z043_107303 [Scleropages formosus]